ncbi:MAG: AraC family transcriptional regulator [Flavobacteriales bacterium]
MDVIYKYIVAHHVDHTNVNKTAQNVYLSMAAFCLFFKKYTKMIFAYFINHYMIHQDQHLLLQGKSVSESCYKIGFKNLSYFNKCFKRIVGESFSDFKNKYSFPI